jgi:predicted permease
MMLAYFSALLPVVASAALGFGIAKRTNWLDSASLPKLVTQVGLPMLILGAMLGMEVALSDLSSTLIAILAVLLLSSLLSLALLWVSGLSVRGFLSMLVNPNTGNLGIPLVFALLGPEALVHAVVISTVVQLSHFSLGVMVLSGEIHPKKLLANPSIVALLVGAIWLTLGIHIPAAVLNTVDFIGGMTLPIMLLLLGKSIASIELREMTRFGRIVGLSVARIGIGAISAGIVIVLLPLPLVVQHTLMIQAMMPVAVMSYILATHYKGPADDIAAIILVSTPLSLIAVGVMQWLMLG